MAADCLPRDQVEVQIDQIELLRAMFPGKHELIVDEQLQQLLASLRQWCDGGDTAKPATVPEAVSLTLNLDVLSDTEKPSSIAVNIEIPLTQACTSLDAPPLKVRVRQPDWLTKAELVRLVDGIPDDDALSAIEHVREQAAAYWTLLQESKLAGTNISDAPIVRVWFGFLLAGKPGILCLEGGAQDIDDYMKFIKTESWGDIPSQHKKVSERYREATEVTRSFVGMQEITDQLEKRGERSNRGDMKALEAWLAERGLHAAFDKVLM